MRGQRIVSKISKFGNFTINNKNADTKEANSNSSRAPLGQISLNAPPSLVTTSSSNDKVPTKTIVDDGEEKLTSFDKFSAGDDDDKQQKRQQQKKLDKIGGQSDDGDKVSTKMGQNGGGKASTTIVGPTVTTATTTVARSSSSEAFEIYADEENVSKAAENDENDGGGDDAGGWDKLTDENEHAVPSSMSLLWLGKENIPPPFEKRDILLNFSSGTDNSSTGAATASSLNSSNSSTKSRADDGDEQRKIKRTKTAETTTTTDSGKCSSSKSRTTTTNTTTTTTLSSSSSSKKFLVVDENAKTCGGGIGTGADGRTDADGGAEVAEDEYSSELSSDRYHCPSEYMTALTHHSLKLTTEQRNAIAAAAAAVGGKMGFRHLKNPMYCAYDADIYRWHLHRERAQCRARNYIPLQSDITEAMRSVLVDWCVDVVTEFELCPATFFLTVSLTDRTLSRVDCPRDKLQLLGAAAVLTASKMHEIFPPTIKDIVHATDDCYTDTQVLRMEKIILKATDFSLGFPLADTFAEFFDYFAPTPLTDVQRHMMWYLLELSTLHYSSVYRHLPSRLAAAAFVIAAACHPTTAPTTTTATKTPLGETVAQQKQNVPVAKQKRKNGDENATELAPPTSALLSSSATAEEQQQKEKEEPFKKWEPMEQKTKILRTELTEPVKTLLKIHRQACASTPDTKLKAVRKKFSDARHDRVARMELPRAFASQIVCD
ncbi:hypothetical protein niasHT_029793 [Heterodera trifolii]|uniref:Cyclin N-terminal domain-containing protein n=1 Tax=Heterodera trifolii TaxID=157864 RepID=A0ABD2KHY3_9BILA